MTKIKNLDELLNSEDSNGSIIELDNFIGELCDYGDDFSKLTDQQKLFYLNQNLEREINNGGFNQYFCNSSGDNTHETIISLKAIGADKTAEILQRAIDQFPNKTVPKDRDERGKSAQRDHLNPVEADHPNPEQTDQANPVQIDHPLSCI
jgi:hypothetical protein